MGTLQNSVIRTVGKRTRTVRGIRIRHPILLRGRLNGNPETAKNYLHENLGAILSQSDLKYIASLFYSGKVSINRSQAPVAGGKDS